MELGVDVRHLQATLQTLVGERNPCSGQRHLASVEMFKEMASYGLQIESDYFAFGGWNFRNAIGKLGGPSSKPAIIVGAHFDSVQGSPGADDNASGLAVLLEAARLLSKTPLRTQVLFCAFQLEEFNMVGSRHFARKLKEAGSRVDAMMSLEASQARPDISD
jgi:putative aminopeptidase FrvX